MFSQPTWQWGREGGGAGNDLGYSISTTPSGNSYVTGRFYGTATFGSYTISSYGGPDIFIAKYNPLGVCIWAHHAGSSDSQDMYGDEGDGIDVDALGNCYVTGNFLGQATFGSTVIGNPSSTSRNIFLVKYDASGNVLWATCPTPSSASSNYSRSVAVDAGGNAYITGYLGGGSMTFGAFTVSGAGGFVVKYDSGGNVVYATKLGVNGSLDLCGVDVDPAGSAYVTGYLQSSDVINSQTYTSTGMRDGILLKVDASGNFLWMQQAQEAANTVCMPNSVCSDGQDGIYWCGKTDNTTIFGTDTIHVNQFSSEIVLVKYDTSGAVMWATQSVAPSFPGNTNAFAVTSGPNANVFMTGSFSNNLLFDSYLLNNNGMGSNTFIVAFNKNTGVCQFGIGSTGQNCGAYGHGISTDNAGSVYITGYDKAPVVFGPDTTVFLGGEDFFIAKIGTEKPSMIGEQDQASPRVFYSSADHTANIALNTTTAQGTSCFVLYDLSGREVKRSTIAAGFTAVALGDLANGIYCWKIEGAVNGAGKILISE